jgi:hypothetical protein
VLVLGSRGSNKKNREREEQNKYPVSARVCFVNLIAAFNSRKKYRKKRVFECEKREEKQEEAEDGHERLLECDSVMSAEEIEMSRCSNEKYF